MHDVLVKVSNTKIRKLEMLHVTDLHIHSSNYRYFNMSDNYSVLAALLKMFLTYIYIYIY